MFVSLVLLPVVKRGIEGEERGVEESVEFDASLVW
jgi:hypothetical protein